MPLLFKPIPSGSPKPSVIFPPTGSSNLNLFLATLDDLLYSYWHQLRSWSFSELFSFLNQACVHLNEFFDLRTDLFKTV